MMIIKRILTASIFLFIIPIFITACGGGGDGEKLTDTTPPDSPSIPKVNYLSNGKLNISGKAEADSTVKITFPDNFSVSISVPNNGNYTVKSPNHLNPYGASKLKLSATDNSGNVSKNTITTIPDITPPAPPKAPKIHLIIEEKLNISGKSEADSTVKITFPDNFSVSISVPNNGNYTIKSANHLNPYGASKLKLSTTDKSGNVSENTTTTIPDITPPAPPKAPKIHRIAGGIINISGKAEAKATVTITFPDGKTKNIRTDDKGNYSTKSSTPQGKGNIRITSTDASGNTSKETTVDYTPVPNKPTIISSTANENGLVTVTGTADAGSTINVIFPNGSKTTTTADSNGNFSVTSNKTQTSGKIEITSQNKQGAISATSSKAFVADLTSSKVLKALYLSTGTMPELPFKPSLGINTEAPQGGADTAGMPIPFVDIFRTARPFKESQRVPKKDTNGDFILDDNGHKIYIQNETTYDANGWPTSIDPDKIYVSTTLLQGTLKGALPEGKYTVLYEGNGTFAFSPHGAVSEVYKQPNEDKYTLELSFHNFTLTEKDGKAYDQEVSSKNQIYFGIKDISTGDGNYIKNIRIVMPGGTCTGNPYIHLEESEADRCPNGAPYKSFAKRLEEDRNAIIFNPAYLLFLRNFKVIRMMNLMEASLKHLCYSDDNCPTGVGTWSYRAKMDDAVWGGNGDRTADEDHKGVPLEVVIALANTLKHDIWLNIPHIATDDYITKAAEKFYADLDPSIKVYLEYSNEVWNSGFAGNQYMTSKGVELHLDTIPQGDEVSPSDKYTRFCSSNIDQKTRDRRRCEKYFARLRYYSQRSLEIFNLWQNKFPDSDRLVRVLGSFIGDTILTDEMLKNIPTDKTETVSLSIDAVAIAPYFYGCPYKDLEKKFCINAPKVLSDATSVDDIFDIIDQEAIDSVNPNKHIDIKSLKGALYSVTKQLDILKKYASNNIKLVTYEGGQHLVPSVFGQYAKDNLSRERVIELRKLFNDANRDPRMKQRYITFMNGWKDLSSDNATLFTLYTLPQSFYNYGNFGLKEHLNKTRQESPKFDGAMTFQETVKECWWDGCRP